MQNCLAEDFQERHGPDTQHNTTEKNFYYNWIIMTTEHMQPKNWDYI